MRPDRWLMLAAVTAALAAPAARADVKLPAVYGDNMVLQQGVPIPVWGWAAPGESIEVKLEQHGPNSAAAQATAFTAGADGKWSATLQPLKADAQATVTLTVKGPKNTVTLKNVAVGEVWLCSGQSNMEWPVNAAADADAAKKKSKNPKIRLFHVAKKTATEPQKDVNAKWVEAGPDTIGSFSAVGYYFGRDLEKARDVPVGLIESDWGGTPAEAWTSREALLAQDSLKYYVERLDAAKNAYDPDKVKKQYEEALARWKQAEEKAKAEGKKSPNRPNMPVTPGLAAHEPSSLFNGMIAPLVPFPIKGALWYQGEANANRSYEYRTLLPTMIEDWRKHWGSDFTFLIVQLAPFGANGDKNGHHWPELREAQALTTTKLKNVGMAVITDVGDLTDIHPRQKEPVGARLALAARALAYAEPIEYSGPVFGSMKVEGNKAVLDFTHARDGLVVKGDKLMGFTVAGEDRKFHPAEATVEGEQVIVSSPEVQKPVAVRFGWANYPEVNLWNKAGLPASPFRTDDWPGVTWPKK